MESFAIHIGDFALSEPTTAVSDFLLTLYCLFICLYLHRRRKGDAAMGSWQLFFTGMGISFLTGVLVHGLRHYQTPEAHYNTWMVMNVITGCSVYFAQIATSRSILKGGRGESWMRTTANVQFIVYLVCIYVFHSFNAVKLQIAAGMIPVMVINFIDYRKGTKGGAWLGVGIGLSFFSAVFHTIKFSISERWFNYNDISHLFLAGSFTMMIMGISRRMSGGAFGFAQAPKTGH
jgi:hypothetical protein